MDSPLIFAGEMSTTCSGLGYGVGVNSTPCIKLNMDEVAPMPSASERTAIPVNAGCFEAIVQHAACLE